MGRMGRSKYGRKSPRKDRGGWVDLKERRDV